MVQNTANECDIFVIGNPLLDISGYYQDDALLTKYGFEKGAACLATPEQMPVYAEIFGHESCKTSPGGAGLNSARGAAYIL
jgi:adenosine kinase